MATFIFVHFADYIDIHVTKNSETLSESESNLTRSSLSEGVAGHLGVDSGITWTPCFRPFFQIF